MPGSCTCSFPHPPNCRALLTRPRDLCQQPRQRQTRWALSPQAGLPVAELTVDAAGRPGAARLGKAWPLTSSFLCFTPHGARPRESLEDRDWTSGRPPPASQAINLVSPGLACSQPAALAQADSGKDVKRDPGLLSTVDRDPGKCHLAALCVF